MQLVDAFFFVFQPFVNRQCNDFQSGLERAQALDEQLMLALFRLQEQYRPLAARHDGDARLVVIDAVARQTLVDEGALVRLDVQWNDGGLIGESRIVLGAGLLEGIDVEALTQLDDGRIPRPFVFIFFAVERRIERDLAQIHPRDDHLRMKTADDDAHRQTRIFFRQRRCLNAFDEDFILVLSARRDRHDIDLHAVLLGDAGLLLGAPQVFVAVGDQDDAFAGSFREGCERQLHGGGNVGVTVVDLAQYLREAELGHAAGGQLDARLLAENDDADAVAGVLRAAQGDRLVDEVEEALFAQILAALEFRRHAQRPVPQENYRNAVVRLAPIGFGQGEGQQHDQRTAQAQNDPAPRRAERDQIANAGPQQQGNQQEQQKPPGFLRPQGTEQQAGNAQVLRDG